MIIEELKKHVRAVLCAAFPAHNIQIAQLGENSGDLGISVFGVERNAVRWVKDTILSLDAELCAHTEFALTPLVRDVEVTRKYYPQFLSAWTAEMDRGQHCLSEPLVAAPTANLGDFSERDSAAWTPAVSASLCAWAANEELALAA